MGEKSVIIEETDSIGDVVDKSVFHGAGGITVLKAEIIAVMGIESYIY